MIQWITCKHVKVDRVACPWLIRKFIDPQAEFLFAPADEVMEVARQHQAIPYDVKNEKLGHNGEQCSFDAIVHKYSLDKDPALALLARLSTLSTGTILPGVNLKALANTIPEGFRHLGFKDDRGTAGAMACGFYCSSVVRVVGGIKCNQSVCLEDLLSIMSAVASSSGTRNLDPGVLVEYLAHVGYFQSLMAPLENECGMVSRNDFAGFAEFAAVDPAHHVRRILA